jgi:hypothetical protein
MVGEVKGSVTDPWTGATALMLVQPEEDPQVLAAEAQAAPQFKNAGNSYIGALGGLIQARNADIYNAQKLRMAGNVFGSQFFGGTGASNNGDRYSYTPETLNLGDISQAMRDAIYMSNPLTGASVGSGYNPNKSSEPVSQPPQAPQSAAPTPTGPAAQPPASFNPVPRNVSPTRAAPQSALPPPAPVSASAPPGNGPGLNYLGGLPPAAAK